MGTPDFHSNDGLQALPVLQHGLGYAMLQMGIVAVLLTVLGMIFRGGSPSAKN